MKQITSDQLPVDYRVFVLKNGMKIGAHKRFCFFCRHCTDIYYDSAGPYMICCVNGGDQERAAKGLCAMFEMGGDGDGG